MRLLLLEVNPEKQELIVSFMKEAKKKFNIKTGLNKYKQILL